jgi:hypothetical protein
MLRARALRTRMATHPFSPCSYKFNSSTCLVIFPCWMVVGVHSLRGVTFPHFVVHRGSVTCHTGYV